MSRARKALDWDRQLELALDPVKARATRERCGAGIVDEPACTMCGEFCAMKFIASYLGTEERLC